MTFLWQKTLKKSPPEALEMRILLPLIDNSVNNEYLRTPEQILKQWTNPKWTACCD